MLKVELEEALEKANRKITRLERQVEAKSNYLKAEVKSGRIIRARLGKYEERYGDSLKKRLYRIHIREQHISVHDRTKAEDRVRALLDAGLWFFDLREVE